MHKKVLAKTNGANPAVNAAEGLARTIAKVYTKIRIPSIVLATK